MTDLLRFLANLLPAGPWFVFGDYYEQGPTYNGWDPAEDGCAHTYFHPDEPVHTARVMDDDEMYAFGEIVGQHFTDNEESIRVACDTAMATLALEEAALRLEGDR